MLEELGIEDVCLVGVAKGPHHGREGREVFHLMDGRELMLPVNAPRAVLPPAPARRSPPLRHRRAPREARQGASARARWTRCPGIGPARKKALLMHFGTGAGGAQCEPGGSAEGAGGLGAGGAAGL